jgi:type I restriction enzyme M protein
VLEATKPAVLAEYAKQKQAGINPEPYLLRKSKQGFYNTSPLDMKKLMGDQDHIRENLYSYIGEFAPAVRDIFERFEFHIQIDRLARAGCCIRSPKNSPTSTCTPKPSAMGRWAWCSKN